MKKLWLFEDGCANYERKCCSRTPIGHISKYFLKSISCIPYVISNLGKSGVHSFRRCSIWSWNEEVMTVWRWLCKHHEQECCSRTPIGHLSKYFQKSKLCILYFVSNLGKSGVQNFKRCSIWSGNEEVMVVWRWLCKQWAEMSQPHPHFATVGHIFGALSGAQIMYTISHFEAWEVRSPMLQTVHDLELKRRSYDHLNTRTQSTNGNFAAAKPPFGKWVPLRSTRIPISQLQNGLWKFPSSVKSTPATKMLQASKNGLRNCPLPAKWPPSFEMAAKSPPSFKMAFKLWNWLAKWREVCKNTLQSQRKLLKCQ